MYDNFLWSQEFVAIVSFGKEKPANHASTLFVFDKADKDGICSICLDDIVTGISIVPKLSCQHVFHDLCLAAWVKASRVKPCPNCRQLLR
jgi:hypothetical protein